MVGGPEHDLKELLGEQIAYYRARAPEYLDSTLADVFDSEVGAARRVISSRLDELAPLGEVLELACGPGTFTAELARRAQRVTAVDASPEMLAIAESRVGGEFEGCRELVRGGKFERGVEFLQADLFAWRPTRVFDFVFFGFWLSHVPVERFDAFWSMVGEALAPGGRAFFLDDAYRTAEELEWGEDSSLVRRRLNDGRTFRAIKVPHEPTALERRLAELGWRGVVQPLAGPFFYGCVSRGERE